MICLEEKKEGHVDDQVLIKSSENVPNLFQKMIRPATEEVKQQKFDLYNPSHFKIDVTFAEEEKEPAN